MRILVIQETDWIKRGPHQQHHLMDRMALRGHEIRVIDHDYFWKEERTRSVVGPRREIQEAAKIFDDASITLVRPGILRLSGFATASELFFHSKEIKKQIREFDPDVIVAFGILNAYLALQQARRKGIPFVYYLIDHLHTLLPYALMRQVARQVEKATVRDADKVLVINKGLKDYTTELGAQPDNVDIITAGVDHAAFNPHVDGVPMRARQGIRDTDLVMFFMGFLYTFSGLKEVAQTLLRATHNHIKLLIVGDGDLYRPLQELAAQSDGKIILTGKVPFDEIPQYIAAADVCLLPGYKNDTMMNIVPIKMYEYMSLGKPVVATKLPGIVKEFGCSSGVLYAETPDMVLDCVNDLVTHGRLREEGKKALEYVKTKDWASIVDQFEETLYNAIDRNRSTRPQAEPEHTQDHTLAQSEY